MAGVEIGWRTQLSTESRPWQIDMLLEEDPSDAITAVTSTLTDLLTGLSFPGGLNGSPTFLGTTVTQNVSGLVAGHNYRLVLLASMGGSKQTATVLLIAVPY